jgi:prephenate dehydrogenase
MCGGNADAVRLALVSLRSRLDEVEQALESRDPMRAVRQWAVEGHTARMAWPPDPGRPQEVPVDLETLLRLGRAGGWITTVAANRRTVTGFLPVRSA